MDKVLSIVMTTLVVFSLIMIALSVFSSSSGDLDNAATGVEGSGCDYQIRNTGPNGEVENLNSRCEGEYEQELDQFNTWQETGFVQ